MKVSIELAMVSGKKRVRVGAIELDVSLESAVTEVQEPAVALTPRETDVLDAILLGLAHKEVADKLHISSSTVKLHSKNIYMKYGVDGRRALLHLLTHLHKALEGQ